VGRAQGRVPRRAQAGVLGAQDRERAGFAAQAPATAGQERAARDHGSPARADARQALERFREEFDAKYPKAVAKLDRDWAALTAFYDFPAEHWRHLRTSNAIESSFATVKLRTRVTKGAGSKQAALAMAYKLLDAAQERWRRFNGHELVADVLAGAEFKDGERVTDHDSNENETTEEKVAA
jgi:putative transposase